jgi:hypothetical protein
MEENFEKNEGIKTKATLRLIFKRTLLAICFSIFTFVVAINPTLLRENILLTIQLTLTLPLLTSSIFSGEKITYRKKIIKFGEGILF